MTDYLALAQARAPQPEDQEQENPYLPLAREAQSLQQNRVRTVLETALKDNPDTAAERLRISQQSGVPLRIVERNMDEVRIKERARMVDLAAMAQESPVLYRQLTDPTFASTAVDDIGTLNTLERALLYTVDPTKKGLASDLGAAAKTVGLGMTVGIGKMAFDMAAVVNDLIGWDEGATGMRGAAKRAQESIDYFGFQGGTSTRDAIKSGLQSSGTNLALLPAGLMRGLYSTASQAASTVAGMMAAGVGADAFNRAREQGKNELQAGVYAIPEAAFEYVFERIPASKLFGDIAANTGLLKTLGKQAVSEGWTEQVTTLAQDFNEWMNLNPNKTLGEFIQERPEAAYQTFVATLVGVGVQTSTIKSIDKIVERASNQRLQFEQDALNEQLKLAGQSMLRTRSPEQFRAHVQQVVDENPEAKAEVFIDAEVLNQMPAELLEQLPESVREQIPGALETRSVVAIPMADVLTIAPGTPLEQALNDNARMTPDSASKVEAQLAGEMMQQEAERILAQAADQDAWSTSAETVKTTILDQLNTAGRFTPDVNEAYATLVRDFYSVTASRAGMTPDQMYARYPLRVGAQGQTAGTLDQRDPGTWYHGTTSDVQKFNRVGGGNMWGSGYYLTDNPDTASGYAEGTAGNRVAPEGNAAPNVMPVRVASGELFEMAAPLTPATLKKVEEALGQPLKDYTWPGMKNRDLRQVLFQQFTTQDGANSLLQKAGFKGLVESNPTAGPGRTLMVFDAKDISSDITGETLAQSPAAFDGPETGNTPIGDATTLKQDQRDLMVTHNLTADNLLHAAKMGGIAVPSLAVTRKDNPLTGFGEITLIGPPEMADPKGYASTKVFGADIYSPRYPSVERELDKKGVTALVKKIQPMTDKLGARQIDTQELERNGQRELERNIAVMATFLTEQGIEPSVVMRTGMDDARRARLEQFGMGPFMDATNLYDLLDNQDFVKAAVAEARDAYASLGKRDSLVSKLDTDEDFQRSIARDVAYKIVEDAKLRKKPEADSYQTQTAMEKQIADADLANVYQQFVADALTSVTKSERIFQGFTNSGNRKYIPHTLENVVKLLKKELRGGEGVSYGVGSVRAKYTPQFKSVAEIRKNKDRLISAADFEKVKQEIDTDFNALLEMLRTPDNGSVRSETLVGILEDAPRMGLTRAAKDYAVEMTPEAQQAAVAFMEKLRTLPTAYFEAKILREVSLSEFKAAVVPEGVNPKAVEALRAAGVTDIRTYAKSNEADRAAKIGEFNDLFFQQARGTYNPQTLLITLGENSDLSTFLHESGHFFLEVLADLASQPNAPAGVAEDMGKVLAWFGIDGANQRGIPVDLVAPIRSVLPERVLTPEEVQSIDSAARSDLSDGRAARSAKESLASFADVTPAQMSQIVTAVRNAQTQRTPLEVWNAMTLDQKRRYHERWAESFEQYLLEGKAPSADLQPLFRRFRSWLVNVYKSLTHFMRGRDLKLNDEIRQVFDRLVATDEQIAQAEETAGMLPDFDATNEAIEKLTARSLRDLKWAVNARNKKIRELQKQAKELRKDVEAEVTAEVNAMPEVRAKEAIDELRKSTPEYKAALAEWKAQRQAAYDQAVQDVTFNLLATEGAGLTGLDKAQFISKNKRRIANEAEGRALDWERQNAKPERTLVGSEADLALVADQTGYSSIEDMLAAIDAFGRKADVIEGMTDQRMLERHGDLVDQRAIEDAATEAVHNDARARALATELKAQADALNPREQTGTSSNGRPVTVNALERAAKEFAKNLAARRRIKDLKAAAAQHRAAEARAGKAWQKATTEGKTQEAVQAKRDQLLNNQAVRALQEAQAEAKKIVEFFRRVTDGSNEKTVERGRDPDVVNAMRAILASYDVMPRLEKGALEYMETVARNDPAMYAALAPSVQAALNNAKPLSEMSMEELRGLNDELRAMWDLAKRSRQMEVDGNLLDIEEAATRLVERMGEIGIPDEIPGERRAISDAEERGIKLQFAKAILSRVEQWAERMDGKLGGPFLRLVFQPVKDAADRYRTARVTYRKQFTKLLENVAPALPPGPIAAPELGYTFGAARDSGTAELLHAILHTGNESNKRKLLLGRGWASENADGTLDTSKWDAFMQRMTSEGKITKAHYDFAQGVWDLLEQMKPLAQETHRKVFGRYFAEVTADPVVTPFGTYRGGYVPAQTDSRLVTEAKIRELAEGENESMAYAFPSSPSGFTKSRVEYNRPLLLDIRALAQHMDKVLLFSHMQGAVTDVRRLLSRKNVSYALDRVQPGAYEGMLISWLNRAAKQVVETPVMGDRKISRFLSGARSRAGMAMMFANLSNTAQQITGFSSAAVKVKPGLLMKATAQAIANPLAMRKSVADASAYMKDRMLNETSAMTDAVEDILVNPSVYEKAQAWSQRHAYFMQSAVDNFMSPIVWTGAYNQAVEQGESHEDAVRFADGTVRQTQGSTLPEDISRFESGPAYARLFTQFVSYFNMMANTNATAMSQIVSEMGLKKGAGKLVYVALAGLLAPIWVAEAIAQAFRGGPEDDDDDGYLDDWLAAVFGLGTLKGLLAQVPIVGQAGQLVLNRFNDNPADDKFSLSPAVSLIESAVSSPASVYKAIVDEGNAQKAVRDVAAAATLATGLPFYAAARPIGYLAGVAQGKVQPTSGADAVRGTVTGAVSPESRTP